MTCSGVRCEYVCCFPLLGILYLTLSLLLNTETFYIVLEFVGGGSLLSILKEKRHKGGLLPWQTRLDYGLQIAKGMSYLASKQVE